MIKVVCIGLSKLYPNQNSTFSFQSSGQVFVSLLHVILYYFTMQCMIRNFKITFANFFTIRSSVYEFKKRDIGLSYLRFGGV